MGIQNEIKKSKKPLDLLIESPGGVFGSCRFKVPELNDKDFYSNLYDFVFVF